MAEVSERKLADTIRVLSMDAVQKAKSGHPGMPMGMADIATVLWRHFFNHNPRNPHWFNRDRFVLSNGHGSMLQYSLLHLTGYDLSIEDIKDFRQLHSKTPGHPEYGDTPGVETTTGPLGQGLANAVGMALAEQLLAKAFNQPDHAIVDHWTYVFAGDGCMMEGVSHEACSLAGTLQLGKLIAFYDDNGISIDGQVKDWYTDDTPKRFESYGWHVIRDVDGHDHKAVFQAIEQARQQPDKPSLICCQTTIGFGAPNLAGTQKTHGAPLGEEEVAKAREALGWDSPAFEVPESIYQAWDASEKGGSLERRWQEQFEAYKKAHPALAQAFIRRIEGHLPADLDKTFESWIKEANERAKDMATRKASQAVLNKVGPMCSELIGGSADLTDSNLTTWQDVEIIKPHQVSGQYLHYGVREFAMAGIMNGLALHGGFIPFGGTFLTFLDYQRNAVRLSALMNQRVIYVFTHDSIGLGEDGPTHQPVEHTTILRATPRMHVWRPCDETETFVAWQSAIQRDDGPTALLLSRQSLPAYSRDQTTLSDVAKGGYILNNTEKPDIILMGTGSEVSLCMQACEQLKAQGLNVRVVSMPSIEVFKAQPLDYQHKVLPPEVTARIAVEAGDKLSWYPWVGAHGEVLGLEDYGLSAPYEAVYQALGMTVEALVTRAKAMVQ